MKQIFLLIFISFIICLYAKSYGQTNTEFSKFRKIKIYNVSKKNNYSYAKEQFTTYQVIFSGMFLFYKNFISSQDSGSCPFEISCSVYMIKSVQSHGVVIGFLNGIDRYMRCNGYSNIKYKINKKTGKLHDSIH